MNILVFFISLIYALIFYIFHISSNGNILEFQNNLEVNSLSGNLLIESILFILIGLFLYFYLTPNTINKQKEKKSINFKNININKYNNFITYLYENYLYYFGFAFLYLSIFFIYKSLYIGNFSIVILIINSIFFILFFISKKFFIFRDFIKINTILFSIYYISFYIINFINKNPIFPLLDMLNSIIIFFSFLLSFYNDKKILDKNKFDKALFYYFFIFLFSFFSYILYIISNYNFIFISIIIGVILNIITYFYFTKLNIFKHNIIELKIIALMFLYIASILGLFFLIKYSFSFFVFLILLYSIFFNLKIHNNYQNYVSFFFSIFLSYFIIYFFYFKSIFIGDNGTIFIILNLILSLEIVILSYFYDFKYQFDYYFIHFFSYIINILAIIYYLFKFDTDLFMLGIIFFVESFYIFLSYFKLKNI